MTDAHISHSESEKDRGPLQELKRQLRSARDVWSNTCGAALAKRHLLRRRRRFTGAYATHKAALQSVPQGALAGYEHEDVVPVSQHVMTAISEWDYPILFWLERRLRDAPTAPRQPGAHSRNSASDAVGGGRLRILDAGGHIGTKFFAFRELIDLSGVDWRVYDLPPMARAGRRLAETCGVSDQLTFCDRLEDAGPCDILLCSGLLQYLDIPFTELIDALDARPPALVLNKVALRRGAAIYTLERIGPAYVPYQFRDQEAFYAEIKALGYHIADSWPIEALAHRIASHPEIGPSESRGFVLTRRTVA
ncbi:MAG: methyltransferase, TIGR04325 family [Pseudomonadota bacterium]